MWIMLIMLSIYVGPGNYRDAQTRLPGTYESQAACERDIPAMKAFVESHYGLYRRWDATGRCVRG